MKIRQGFVSNSSSSSFVLKRYPKDFNTKDIYKFYGMDEGRASQSAKMALAHYIFEEDKTNQYSWFMNDYFYPNNREEFFKYHGYNFDDGYGEDVIDDIFNQPDEYFEFEIGDDYMSEAGCAYKGSFITKNGIEINCH